MPLVAVAVLVLGGCAGPVVELGPTTEQMLDAGPGRESSAYRELSDAQGEQVAQAVVAGLKGADDPPLPDGTSVRQGVDSAERPILIVAEEVDDEELRGVGLYAVRPGAGAPPDLVVEVPHPRADRWTEELGQQLFTALDAEALFVAGAHRSADDGAADVAHEPASTFAAVDRAVVGPGTVVLQVHGFDESKHEGSEEVVVSSAEPTPAPLVRALEAALEDAGIETCVYDGRRCRALAGTKNVQAAHARNVGATFIHLELAPDLRERGAGRDELVEILTEVLAR